MAINLQDLPRLSDRLPEVASLLQESRVKWLTDPELESLYQARIKHPSLLPISQAQPPLKTEGIFFFLQVAYRDKNQWDPINSNRNTQSTNIFHDLPNYHTTVATKTNKDGSVFSRRNQRCKKHGNLAIIHYRLEEVNGEVEALKEKTKHAKSKFKASDSDVPFRIMGSSSSSSPEDSSQQQKEHVEVQKKKTLREILEPGVTRRLEFYRRSTLHLSNLSYDVTEDDIRNFFSGIGARWMQVRIPLGQDRKCRGFAFVQFNHPEIAEQGLKLNLTFLLNRLVRISISRPRAVDAGAGAGAPGVGRGRGTPGVVEEASVEENVEEKEEPSLKEKEEANVEENIVEKEELNLKGKEDVNVEVKETKHPKSKLKATDTDGRLKTFAFYSSSSDSAESSQQQKIVVSDDSSSYSSVSANEEPKMERWKGMTMRELLARRSETVERSTLHLSNLSYDVTKADIINFFSRIGRCREVRIPLGEDMKCRGFAFVSFDSLKEAQEGLKLNLTLLLNRSVRITVAHPRFGGGAAGRGAPGVGRGRGAPDVGRARGGR